MFLKKLIVKNFQIHKDLTINLIPGFNVIIGDTGEGKSSIIRALSLLLQNKPRSAERIFQNRLTKNPMEIILIDDKGNKICRTKKKYFINKDQPLRAFGSTVPEPVNKIFPLKDVNWQRQLEQHFLIMNSGGSAAKVLNASSGMEDQEALIKVIKDDISNHKSDIKRLNKNNEEHNNVILKLRNIPHFYMKAKAIKQIEEEYNAYSNKISKISHLLNKYKEYEEIKDRYKNIPQYIKECDDVITIFTEVNTIEQLTSILENNLNKLNKIQKIKDIQKVLNNHIIKINNLFVDFKEYNNINKLIGSLTNYLSKLEEQKVTKKELTHQISKGENVLNLMFKELGVCPLCGETYKGKHSC